MITELSNALAAAAAARKRVDNGSVPRQTQLRCNLTLNPHEFTFTPRDCMKCCGRQLRADVE